MMDTYVCSKDQSALVAFLGAFDCVIGPVKGIPAQAATDDAPAQAAIGDAQAWYACIRTEEPVSLASGISAAEPLLGVQIVGVWAE